MLNPKQVFEHMLRLQADLLFPMELCLYQSKTWQSAQQVLDFGCGNAHYTSLLKNAFPQKKYTGIDIDADLLGFGQERYGNEITLIHGGTEKLPLDYYFDFILVRLVSLHLPDRSILYNLAKKHSKAGAGVVVVDVDDDLTKIEPLPNGISKVLSDLKISGSHNREQRKLITQEWADAGFQKTQETQIIINSDMLGYREKMFLYLLRMVEIGCGGALTPKLLSELLEWIWQPSAYVQVGMFGAVFQKDD